MGGIINQWLLLSANSEWEGSFVARVPPGVLALQLYSCYVNGVISALVVSGE